MNARPDFASVEAAAEELSRAKAAAAGREPRPVELVAHDIGALMKLDVPPREELLAPVIRERDLTMLVAARGMGKTAVATSVAVAVAGGGRCLRWQAPKRRRVVYVDGELPLEILRARFAAAVLASQCDPEGYLKVIASELQSSGFPSLVTHEGQAAVEAHLDGAALLILDSVSTLCRGGEENAAESWQEAQDWLLTLRRRGLAVLLLHHAGRNGLQRGTSKREDVLDTIISLTRPKGYLPSEGCRFVATFEKSRSLYGEAVAKFEAQLVPDQRAPFWTIKTMAEGLADQVHELAASGLGVSEIAREVGRHKSTVSRILTRGEP